MSLISVNSLTVYRRFAQTTSTGTGSYVSDRSTAIEMAKSNAKNNTSNPSVPRPSDGGDIYTSYNRFGFSFSSSVDTAVTSVTDLGNGEYRAKASCTKTYESTAYQLKIKFNIPSGITSASIDAATLSFDCAVSGNGYTYAVCAPTSNSEQDQFYKYSTSTIFEQKNSFEMASNDTSKTIDITDTLKQCIDNNQGWFTLLRPVDGTNSSSRVDVDLQSVEINYTLSYSKCTAPTAINFTPIVAPGGTLVISWSGAQGGANNDIIGYELYYKIGAPPTTSDTHIEITTSAASGSTGNLITIPINAVRSNAFYTMIRTKGALGVNYYSDWAYASGGKVNSIPGAPNVSASSSILPEGGGNVTFTITPGYDEDTSQTLSLYYSEHGSSEKTLCQQSLTKTIGQTTVYDFYTFDGLEYSSYTSQEIEVIVQPTVGSVQMTAVHTFSLPSGVEDGYVKNINASATGVAGNHLTYQWELWTKDRSINNANFSLASIIGTTTTLNNIDVTAYGVGFNTAYKIRLVVTDDMNQTGDAYSSTVFGIPAAPSIYIFNQFDDQNLSTANPEHFGRNIRIKFYEENNGIDTRKLQYSTDSNFSSYETIFLSEIDCEDLVLDDSLLRGTTYYFRVEYTCNNLITLTSSEARKRALDITPNNITIQPQNSSKIKPYTDNIFTISFGNQPSSLISNFDVQDFMNTYTFKFINGSQNLDITRNSGSDSDGTVTGQLEIDDKSTNNWKNLIGSTDAPNKIYSINLQVTATNGFGEKFSKEQIVELDFIEGIPSGGTGNAVLSIKTSEDPVTFTNIPGSSSNRYPLFETQTIRVTISGLQSYANQDAVLYLKEGSISGTTLGVALVSSNDWTAPSGNSHIYTLNGNKTIDYIIPAKQSNTDVNYYIYIELNNGQTGSISNNLNICKYRRFSPQSIDFTITNVVENSTYILVSWQYTDLGGDSYSDKIGRILYSATPDGTYSVIGANCDFTKTSDTISISSSSISSNTVYFGLKLNLTLDFISIGQAMPIGIKEYEYSFLNITYLYRDVPNIMYGKNFFVMNAKAPKTINGNIVTDQLITIYPKQNKNKIYIGPDGVEGIFEISQTDGLIIDCGSW